MKLFITISLSILFLNLIAQDSYEGWNISKLNTAANTSYMNKEEKAMVLEINMVRSDPNKYIQYIEPYLKRAKEDYEKHGKGTKNYALSTSYETINGVEKIKTDTIWHNRYEEELKAIEGLIADLKSLGSLSILKPSEGIYKAAKKHGLDNDKHKWTLSHRGSDNSWPWDRILKYAPRMVSGNENIAGKGPGDVTAREIVIQLLIDSGIPGYGHRTNIINPDWTHIACYYGGLKLEMHRWIQNFGKQE